MTNTRCASWMRLRLMRFCLCIFLVSMLCAVLPQAIFAQRVPPSKTINLKNEDTTPPEPIDDMDNIFDEAEDISVSDEEAAQQEAAYTETNKAEKFSYNGSLEAGIGGIEQISPDKEFSPYAAFEARLGLTLRPADILTIKTDAYAKFADMNKNNQMEWKLNTLYFDYILYDRVFITVGRTATQWGNARLFDTNILDDSSDTLLTDASVLDAPDTDNAQYFDAIVTVPINHGYVQTLMMYYPFSSGVTQNDLSFAAEVEYPFGPVAINLFGRTWADTDKHKMDPAIGAQLTAEIMKFHIGAWSKVNIGRKGPNYSKTVLSFYRMWDEIKIGFIFEYQLVYNNIKNKRLADDPATKNDASLSNAIALTWTWRHILGSDLSPMIQWFSDFENNCGAVVPGISWTGLPLVTVTFIAPIFYGNQTNVDYNDLYVSSTSGTPTVLLGVVAKLRVTF